MHFQSVDRCFNREFGYWNENFDLWPLFKDSGVTSNAEADLALGFDVTREIGPVWMHPVFEYKVVEETATHRVIRNTEGLLAEIPVDGHDTIPHFLKSSIETPDDWLRCKEQRFRRDDPARRPDVAALREAHPDDRDYPLGVQCGSMIGRIRDLLTVEGLAYACYDYPDMVEDMVETQCVLVEDYLDEVLPHLSFEFASGWEDICFKSGPLVTLDFFEQVVVPRYKRIQGKLSAAGIDVWYTDTDGDVRPLIPFFLESGLNCLFPYEVICSGHPSKVLEQYGNDLLMMGGVDKHALLHGPEAITAYLKGLEPLVERGGFIPHVDHRCPPDVTPENYFFYLDLKQKMFG
jgi:uroporphyrinogen decarboxylase